ncbi:MAG: hypothetical protein J0H64_07945, partial [Actinobacteria bacterium]|nr:hypothetical protein [Actinomycetota bacterium]
MPNHLDGRLQNIGAGYAASFQKVTVEGRGEALRWKFITGAAPHIYRSTITVLLEQNPREPSWVWFDVETDRENSHFSPPRLTGLLTRQLESSPRDRISGFTQGMRKVAAEDLGKFLDEVLEAEDRTVPAFVSGGRDWSLEDEEHVERALQPLYGIGTFWKLAPDAFDEFNSMVGSGYSVYSGSIHSFQFGLDTTDEKDTRRHWWFSPAEVRQASPRDLSRRMHTEAMQSGLHVPLPDRLSSLNPLFDQLETRRLFGQFQVARASGLQTDPPP